MTLGSIEKSASGSGWDVVASDWLATGPVWHCREQSRWKSKEGMAEPYDFIKTQMCKLINGCRLNRRVTYATRSCTELSPQVFSALSSAGVHWKESHILNWCCWVIKCQLICYLIKGLFVCNDAIIWLSNSQIMMISKDEAILTMQSQSEFFQTVYSLNQTNQ